MSRVTEQRDITYKSAVLVSAACDNCGAALELKAEGWLDQPITVNTLGVRVGSGYHGFWDGSAELEFCSACSEKLLAQFPSILRELHNERGF